MLTVLSRPCTLHKVNITALVCSANSKRMVVRKHFIITPFRNRPLKAQHCAFQPCLKFICFSLCIVTYTCRIPYQSWTFVSPNQSTGGICKMLYLLQYFLKINVPSETIVFPITLFYECLFPKADIYDYQYLFFIAFNSLSPL